MSNVVRVALPGFNALTDTNLDHFSLYSDVDNVLIKRLLSQTPTIADGGPTTDTIAHSLGYIPFFMTYYSPNQDGVWTVLNNQYNVFSVPDAICGIDTSNLTIQNYGGHGSGNIKPAVDIFYDNMSDTTAPSITESKNVFKVARPGKSVFSTNPNDFIMHSDLNNFKILASGKSTGVTIPHSTSIVSIAHGANVQEPFKFFVFVKAADGKTFLTGNAVHMSYDESFGVTSTMDATNINLHSWFTSSDQTVDVYWLIYGSGKDNTISVQTPKIAVAKSGKNVLTETNPDNFNFHSAYATLKYYLSGSWDMGSISASTVKTIAHNLGYVPFFVGFVNDIAGILSNAYAIIPFYKSNNTAVIHNHNTALFMYADSTNIYLKAFYQSAATETIHPIFYYKLFKNNLGL